jgi:hypothetical protein
MDSLGIGGVIKEGNGNVILYTALLAAMAANAIPTIADGIYFTRINKLERQFDAGEITAEKLEWHVAGEYYLWTASYYALLFGGLYAFGGNYKTNAKILLGLVSAGLIVGIVQKNIEVDKAIQARKAGTTPSKAV